MAKSTSRSFLNPKLVEALRAGQTFEGWLAGRVSAVDYARISGDQALRSSTKAKGREKGIGVRHQHEENIETARANNLAIVKMFEDNNITAADPDLIRPSFLDMSRELLHRRTTEGYPVRVCVATEYERVWRLPEDYIRFRRAVITRDDGEFYERKHLYDIRSTGGNIVGLVNAGVSEGEVAKTKERITRNARRRALDGTSPGGRRRFGWLPQDVKTGRAVNVMLDPVESRHAKWMVRQGLKGRAWKSIATDLRARGVVGATGAPWTGETVRQYLVNPVICGLRQIRGELVRNPETGELVVGKWQTIATIDEWRALVQMSKRRGAQRGMRLTNGSRRPGQPESRTRKYLFSGFLRCGNMLDDGTVCLTRMGGSRRPTSSDPDNAVYPCTSLGCCGVSRKVKDIDRYLEPLVLAALERKFQAVKTNSIPWQGTDALADLLERQKSLKAKWLEGVVSDRLFYELLPDLEDKISGLEQDRAEHAEREAAKATFSGWDRSKWYEMDLEQKRQAIGLIISAVIVSPLPKGRSKRSPFDPTLLRVVGRS